MATPLKRHVTVSLDVPNTNPAVADIWAKALAATKAQAAAESGLDVADIKLETGAVLSLSLDDTETHVSISYSLDGSWSKS